MTLEKALKRAYLNAFIAKPGFVFCRHRCHGRYLTEHMHHVGASCACGTIIAVAQENKLRVTFAVAGLQVKSSSYLLDNDVEG